jgi:hypothetical protein
LVFQPTGLKVLHDFTTDPKVLVAALHRIKPSRTAADSIVADEEVLRSRTQPKYESTPGTYNQLVASEATNIQNAFSDFTLL